jgi:hypothetical protein
VRKALILTRQRVVQRNTAPRNADGRGILLAASNSQLAAESIGGEKKREIPLRLDIAWRTEKVKR